MRFIKLMVSLGLSFSAAAVGSLATISSIPTWYATLEKPAFNPPNWVFGPVWSVLYAAIGLSLYLVWTSQSQASKRKAYVYFALQLVLNASWSLIFFGLQQIWIAAAVIVLLLITILLCIVEFRQFSKLASLLFVPYILWVSFATLLTFSIGVINS